MAIPNIKESYLLEGSSFSDDTIEVCCEIRVYLFGCGWVIVEVFGGRDCKSSNRGLKPGQNILYYVALVQANINVRQELIGFFQRYRIVNPHSPVFKRQQ